MYIPKRIHFSTQVFTLRMNLAVMHCMGISHTRCILRRFMYSSPPLQNENVNQPLTSQHKVKDLWRPDRRTAMKVLVKKSYKFVDEVWSS